MTDRQRWMTAAIPAILLALSLAACSGANDQAEEGTPAAAVQEFYRHLDQGQYDSAQAMYSAEARDIVADPEMFRSWADQATRQRSIDRVSIVDSTVDESQTSATVDFEIAFEDGSSEAYSVDLVDEGGAWKLGLVVPK